MHLQPQRSQRSVATCSKRARRRPSFVVVVRRRPSSSVVRRRPSSSVVVSFGRQGREKRRPATA
jgi:hypothetical protein